MEQIITLKVDLEYPDEAHHAIDEADKLKWTETELAEAKHLAMQIMTQLCLDGYSIKWYDFDKDYDFHSICVCITSKNEKNLNGECVIRSSKFDVWIAKCVCLYQATGRDVPEFIIKKAGEC
mgnify:CR=1 FL=1